MGNRIRSTVGACVLFLLAGSAWAQVRVAVTPFEASDYALSPYADHARGIVEDLLINFGGIEMIERARMDAMVEEMSLGQHSGLVDSSQAAQFGRGAGARFLVTGTLLKADTEVREFSGYNVRTRTDITTATIRVRAYDVERGSIVYSTTAQGESRNFNTSSGGQGQVDQRSAAIANALGNLAEDPRFRAVFSNVSGGDSTARPQVALEIAPVPDNCDLEVNGAYEGSTPATINLPEGATVTIRLTKAGYLPWERSMSIREGLRVTPELEPAPN